MGKLSVGELVKSTTCRFQCYRDGDLWYDVYKDIARPEGAGIYYLCDVQVVFSFPVPVADTGTGIFEAEMKSIQLMRWIRKQLEKEKSYEIFK